MHGHNFITFVNLSVSIQTITSSEKSMLSVQPMNHIPDMHGPGQYRCLESLISYSMV